MSMRNLLVLLAACSTVLCAAGDEKPAPVVRSQAVETAISRGLKYLARTQSSDGGWGEGGTNDVAFTALSGMAFLASGSTPKRGPYADNISRAVSFLLSKADPTTGLIAPTNGSLIHCHGYAMLFLGEVYGMECLPEHRERIRNALLRAIKLTAESQSKAGGWYYSPGQSDDEGSTTVTQVEGLRACRNAGLTVPGQVIERALDYIKKSQNADGSVRYKVSQQGGGSPALTAAGLMCFFSLGEYGTDNIKRGLKYLDTTCPGGNIQRGGHFMYTHLYASQAYFLAGEPYWSKYWKEASKMFVQSQASDGMWPGDIGPAFDTAVACIILQIPYGYLPILQK